MQKHSKILLYATLMLLASFLIFWVYGEFQRAKHAMQNEMHLNIAKQLIKYGGGDFKSILSELEGLHSEASVKIGVFVNDSLSEEELPDRQLSRAQRHAYLNKHFYESDTLVNESYTKVTKIRHGSNDENIEGVVSIVMDVEGGQLSLDSLSNLVHDSTFLAPIKQDLQESQQNINAKVFVLILPQIIFAFFLFGLLTSGIYLLQKNNRDQQELLESKNNLISNITHELQTPIATISVALEAIQDFNVKNDQEKTNRYIQTSRNELQRLSSAVDQVMLLSKMDSHAEMYQFEEYDISILCHEVMNDLQIPISQKKATVNFSISEKMFTTVDANHFKNMLFNLMDNALKYGKNKGQVDVVVEQLEDVLIIKVKDDGIGILKKYQQKIFERFYRISNGNRHDVKGYGLGLSYVSEVVKAHDGNISMESEEGVGTTFTIELPKKKS